MKIVELQQKYPLKNIINQTRIKQTDSLSLCKIHQEFGNLLAMEILAHQKTIAKRQILSSGKEEDLEYYDDNNFVIVGILRAGLYIAQGIREKLPKSSFILAKKPKSIDMTDMSLVNKKIILVDSVINTGKTMEIFLDFFKNHEIYIATNVIYGPTIETLQKSFNVSIFAIRISNNSYTGQGNSDTGNRLFNTMDCTNI